jgi:nitrous oxide reductase accessory protein NosL
MMTRTSSVAAFVSVFVFALFFFSGLCQAQKQGENKMGGQSAYNVPEEKRKQWESISGVAEKEYNVCLEHCGGDSACQGKCKEAYTARLDRGYQGLLAQAGTSAAPPDIAEHASCPYCGMDRAKFAHSRIYIQYDNGSTFGGCSMHCAAIDMALNIDKAPKVISVGDYETKKLIDGEKAFWVIGGNKMGVMTKRAKWAFESKSAVERFIQQEGGKLSTFEDAMKASYEDMYEDTKMIRDRRQMKRMKMKSGS